MSVVLIKRYSFQRNLNVYLEKNILIYFLGDSIGRDSNDLAALVNLCWTNSWRIWILFCPLKVWRKINFNKQSQPFIGRKARKWFKFVILDVLFWLWGTNLYRIILSVLIILSLMLPLSMKHSHNWPKKNDNFFKQDQI